MKRRLLSDLTPAELHALVRDIEHEVVRATRTGQPYKTLNQLLAHVEAAIDRLADDGQPPSIERRQRLYAER